MSFNLKNALFFPDVYVMDIKKQKGNNSVYVASGSDNLIRVLDASTNTMSSQLQIHDGSNMISDFVFENENCIWIASKSSPGGVLMWDTRTPTPTRTFESIFDIYSYPDSGIAGIPALSVSLNANNTLLAVVC